MSDCDEPLVRLWIRNPDDRGHEVDQRLIDVAHRLWPRARLIVIRFLGDDEEAPRIVERAVHQASRALARNGPVAMPENYLLKAIARQSLREFKDRKRFVPLDESLLDRRQSARWQDSENRAVNRLLLEQLKACMDDKTRRMFDLRCLDFDWGRIAEELHYGSSHSAEVQFQKGIENARRRLRGKKQWPTKLTRKDPDSDDRS